MKKHIQIVSVGILGIILVPIVAYAAEFAGLKGLIQSVGSLVKMLTVLVAGIALLGFFYGLMRFVFRAGDPKAQEEGKSIMIWGIIALFLMVSVFGIIGFIQNELGISGGGSIIFPGAGQNTDPAIIPGGIQSPCGGPCPVSS